MSSTYKREIVWTNVFLLTAYHYFGLHGLYHLVTAQHYWITFLWAFLLGELSNIGTICGAHRLWSHRTYKARLPLRLFLIFCNTLSYQTSVYVWARDHRVHHKFTDTDADPYNINRGFFFAHMGWIMVRKHPDVINKGKSVDMSDLENDRMVMWQHRYFTVSATVLSFVVPTVVPWYYWGEDWYVAFCVAGMFRYVVTLHGTWLVNSVAHLWGTKPYDSTIKPTDNMFVSYVTHGEGWHNYHHTFPWDYKAAELDSYNGNSNTAFIDLMAKIGLAYDLKTASAELVKKRVQKTKSESAFVEEKKFDKGDLVFVPSSIAASEVRFR
ncbi:unnamed protein product [Tenebrio molitor]|nr:unnamed protein product [Tenebrio molitor]